MADKKKNYDISNLENALMELTAQDYANAEKACRAAGDTAVEISFSSNFRARLAAKALDIPYTEVNEMNIKDYATITLRVGNFLLGSLAEG